MKPLPNPDLPPPDISHEEIVNRLCIIASGYAYPEETIYFVAAKAIKDLSRGPGCGGAS